jgi:hypothetical protein
MWDFEHRGWGTGRVVAGYSHPLTSDDTTGCNVTRHEHLMHALRRSMQAFLADCQVMGQVLPVLLMHAACSEQFLCGPSRSRKHGSVDVLLSAVL